MPLLTLVVIAAFLGSGPEFRPAAGMLGVRSSAALGQGGIRDLTPTAGSLEGILARMDAYLLEYESQLSSIVADEVFDQKVFYRRSTNTRRLESEVAFMRLPGEGGWLGFRDVKKVEHQPI